MKNVYLLLLVSLLFGCADTHKLTRNGTNLKLDPSVSLYISVPLDGRYGQTIYHGSGLTTTQAVLKAFSVHMINIETGREYQSFNDALEYAKAHNHKYLIFPSILEWEDRATEWSGIPDRVSIKVAIIATSSGRAIDSAIVEGESGLGTFGGDKPQDLLAKPIKDYVSLLF